VCACVCVCLGIQECVPLVSVCTLIMRGLSGTWGTVTYPCLCVTPKVRVTGSLTHVPCISLVHAEFERLTLIVSLSCVVFLYMRSPLGSVTLSLV
jgi:hypothetical protein